MGCQQAGLDFKHVKNKAGLKVLVCMCWSCIWFWIQWWWRLDLDERAADICGLRLDWNLPQSTQSSFRAAAAPQLRKPAKHFRTTSAGASGGRWVQEQHIKIIKCYQMCVCSISSVGVKILSGPAWQQSFYLIYMDILGYAQQAAIIIDCTGYTLQSRIKRTAFLW